ncbi:MAG: peptide chain release factor N(5)-glutamine methyltransferase [Luteimonas sp.]
MPEDRASPRLDGLLREAAGRIGTVDAQWLLAHALGKPRSWLYAHADDCLDAQTSACFAALVERRHQGEPVAYLTGRRGFWKFELQVTPDTLIPRPETELLVERALDLLPRDAASRIADLGTGTGAVALALAFERPRAQVLATDASARALEVARGNARALRLGNIAFATGDWLAALGDARFDLIASNPPYIATGDPHLGDGDLRFEPTSALASGADGLDAIRRIARDAARHLKPGGWLLLEHGFDQGEPVRALLAHAGFHQVRTERDLEGRERVTIGMHPASSQAR